MNYRQTNEDCLFFYKGFCMMGDSCSYRHSTAALGSLIVCKLWKEGKCFNEHCKFRHTFKNKIQAVQPCIFENTPSGCLNSSCRFFHTRKIVKNSPIQKSISLISTSEPSSLETVLPTVDGLVIKVDEEDSDSDCSSSVTSISDTGYNSCPKKTHGCKSEEELKLEKKIKSVDLYDWMSYAPENSTNSSFLAAIYNPAFLGFYTPENLTNSFFQEATFNYCDSLDFKIKTLDEIRQEKQKNKNQAIE